MMKPLLFQLAILAMALPTVHAGQILYGVNGGHPNPDGSPLSINNGWLVTVDQTTGAVTPIGQPAGVSKMSGLAFEPNGDLFGSALSNVAFPPPAPSSPTTNLVRINPATGALLAIVPVKAGGNNIQIADLAVQPGTGVLFGISASSSGDFNAAGNLYTINTTTGAATLVGATGDFFGAIAFAPNGTLYMHSADLDNMGNMVNTKLKTLNPTNAQTLTAVATLDIPGALGVRSDGTIFAGDGDSGRIYTINPLTGEQRWATRG
jgi:sugar lactone lactonase YvrE